MRHKFFALSALIVIAGCAPLHAGPTVGVAGIPLLQEDNHTSPGLERARLRIDKFGDSRADPILGQDGDQSVRAASDPGAAVQAAFEERLKRAGAQITLFDSSVLSGSITKWEFTLTRKLPLSNARAEAAITVELRDRSGKVNFRGTYSGSVELERPLINQDNIERILAEAMAHAVSQAFTDARFEGAVSS